MANPKLKKMLEGIYNRYNRRAYVHPDPLEFLYRYDDVRDREIAGLVASGLAYGNVRQIIKAVGHVLDVLGPNPRAWLEKKNPLRISSAFSGFKYRFTDEDALSALLSGVRSAVRYHGSLKD
ncbi:MAG: DUF2400 family protein, partial [Elusimicrobiaceae bacterium]